MGYTILYYPMLVFGNEEGYLGDFYGIKKAPRKS